MMAATLADGVTTIEMLRVNQKSLTWPFFFNEMGADVKGAGTETLVIKGVKALHGTKHAVVSGPY